MKVDAAEFSAASTSAIERAAFSGWLVKRGFVNRGSWKRRFFVLDGTLLYYFNKEAPHTASNCVGVMLLQGARSLLPEGGEGEEVSPRRMSLAPAHASGPKGPPELLGSHPAGSLFGLVLKSGRVLSFVAPSAAERAACLAAVASACEPRADSRPPQAPPVDLDGSVEDNKHALDTARTEADEADSARDEAERVRARAGEEEAERARARASEAEARLVAAETEAETARQQAAAARADAEAARKAADEAEATWREERARLEAERDEEARKARRVLEERILLPPPGPVWSWRNADGVAGGADAGATSERGVAPLRVWVATWNMGASNPFESGDARGRAPFILSRRLVPPGYDLYFFGFQECVSESVHEAIEALLVMQGCVRLRAGSADRGEDGHADRVEGRGDGSLVGTKFTGVAVFASARARAPPYCVRVLRFAARCSQSLSSKGGAGVALALGAGAGARTTTLAFVSCHLEAKNNDERLRQYQDLSAELGRALGEPTHALSLTKAFSHVIWCGDFNYRCVAPNGGPIDADSVVRMIERGELRSLWDSHDQLGQEMRKGLVFADFGEPVPMPDFFPTYKKFENRNELAPRADDPKWVRETYRIRYKEPFYKGGKEKERTPGFCDRVLYASLSPELASLLVPETVEAVPVHGAAGAPLARVPMQHYTAINSGERMEISDHSPVIAAFALRVEPADDDASGSRRRLRSHSSDDAVAASPLPHSPPEPRSYSPPPELPSTAKLASASTTLQIQIRRMHLSWGEKRVVPLGATVIFPAPYEALSLAELTNPAAAQAHRRVAARKEAHDARGRPAASATIATMMQQLPAAKDARRVDRGFDGGTRVRWQANAPNSSSSLCASFAMAGQYSIAALTRHHASGAADEPLDDSTAVLPPLPICWRGDEGDVPLDQVHLLVRVEYCDSLVEPTHGAAASAAAQHATVASIVARELKEAQCAIALKPFVREWRAKSERAIKTARAELRRHGAPINIGTLGPLHLQFELELGASS